MRLRPAARAVLLHRAPRCALSRGPGRSLRIALENLILLIMIEKLLKPSLELIQLLLRLFVSMRAVLLPAHLFRYFPIAYNCFN